MGSGAANRGDPCGGPPGPGAGAADLERRTGGPQAEARSEGVRSGPPLACYLNFSELRKAEVPRILLLRACANRRVSYVSKSSKKAVQSLREMSCAKGCPPIGAASKASACRHGNSR